MTRPLLLFVVCVAVVATGCGNTERIENLEQRMTTLETEHTATRSKLQALLVWVNRKPAPDVGLMNWIDAVHAKVFPGPTDPVKPANPPDPF